MSNEILERAQGLANNIKMHVIAVIDNNKTADRYTIVFDVRNKDGSLQAICCGDTPHMPNGIAYMADVVRTDIPRLGKRIDLDALPAAVLAYLDRFTISVQGDVIEKPVFVANSKEYKSLTITAIYDRGQGVVERFTIMTTEPGRSGNGLRSLITQEDPYSTNPSPHWETMAYVNARSTVGQTIQWEDLPNRVRDYLWDCDILPKEVRAAAGGQKNIYDGVLKSFPEATIGYGATAWVQSGTCQGCGTTGLVLTTTSSGDEEYTPVQICQACLKSMFQHPQK